MGLRLRLILLIIFPVLLAVVAAGLFTFETVRTTLIADAREEAVHIAADLAVRIGDTLATDAQVPGLLARIDPAGYGSPERYFAALHAITPAMLTEAGLFNLGVFFEPDVIADRRYAMVWYLSEPSGAPRELTPNLPGNPGYNAEQPVYDFHTQEWFVVGRAVPGLLWSEPYFDTGGADVPMVKATVPVRTGDQVIGVATTDVPLVKVRELASALELTPNGYAMIVSGQGQIIAHTLRPELELAESLRGIAEQLASSDLARLDEELLVGLDGELLIRDPWRGAEAWVAWSAVPITGWTVVVVTPVADVLAPVEPLQRTFLRAAGLLFLGLVVVVSIAATWFLRPIQKLTRAVERLADGERGRVDLKITRRDELGQLARSFERMADEVAEAQSGLEATVAARTQELQGALASQRDQAAALQKSLDEIRQQRELIATMSTPVIPVRHDTLIVPIIGLLEAERATQLITQSLQAIERQRARTIILDVTGLPVVDTAAARAIVDLGTAAQLLGARVLLVGIAPEVAQSLIALGVDLGDLQTLSTLEEAVAAVLLQQPGKNGRSVGR